MGPDPAGPGDPQAGPLSDPLALVRQERGVGGQDHDDGAGLGSGRMVVRRGNLGARDLPPDGHAVDREPFAAAVVRLDQRAHHVPTLLPRQRPGGRPDAALELVADHAGPTADVAFGDGPVGGRLQRRPQVLGPDVLAVDVVEHPVPRLADHGQAPPELPPPPAADVGRDQGVADHAHAVRVGDGDRGGEHAGLPDPVQAGDLAVAVQPVAPGEQRAVLDPVVGNHDRDAGSDRSRPHPERAVPRDQRGVAHPDASHIGDRVQRARRVPADPDAQLARPRFGLH